MYGGRDAETVSRQANLGRHADRHTDRHTHVDAHTVTNTDARRYETKMPERFGGYVGAYLNDGLHAKVECVLSI